MVKLDFTKKEIEDIKSKIYLTEDEEKVLDKWLVEKTIVEMSLELSMSTATISRRKKSIIKKIMRVI